MLLAYEMKELILLSPSSSSRIELDKKSYQIVHVQMAQTALHNLPPFVTPHGKLFITYTCKKKNLPPCLSSELVASVCDCTSL